MTSWAPVDLAPYLDGSYQPPAAGLMFRDDGAGMLYPGQVHFVVGESGAGKGWLVNYGAAQVIDAGGNVLFIDHEDDAGPVTARLMAVGLSPAIIGSSFGYIRPTELLSEDTAADLEAALDHYEPALVIIDGTTEAMTGEGLDPNGNADVAMWLARVARPIADRGPAVVLIDHVPKDRSNRTFALGGQHKRAGSAVTYMVETKRPIEIGRDDGLVRVKVAKDRHGTVQAAAHGDTMPKLVAEFHVSANDDGSKVSARLTAPAAPGTWRPTTLMEKVSRHLETYAGLSLRQLRTDVGGRAEYVSRAVDVLVAEGYVHIEPDTRGAHRHHSTRPYRADTDPLSDTYQKQEGSHP